MWDTFRLSSVGNFSLRKIALLFVAVLMSAFLMAAVHSTSVFAVDATWNGDSISYESKTYTKKQLTLPGTDHNSQIFVHDPDPSSQGPKSVEVIVIPGGADTSQEIANAREVDYRFENGTYSSPSNDKTISVSAQSGGQSGPQQNSQNGEEGEEQKTSCDVGGVGWIICSTSRFMASSMDRIYGWISDFLTVKPLSTDTSSPLFQTWMIMRGLANICFILVFLIIIYAQITSYGMSNYEIKKMIPRLIIAAILVNVSYYICAIAVDVSNILGDSIQKAMSDIRSSLPVPYPDGQWWHSWESWAAFILSGGAIAGAGFAVFTAGATGGSIAALATLLFPVLVAAILSVLVALMVLAARQALITVLIVLSPLAFVLFLLPNTEKYFEKWRGLFLTMLMVFPMFSLLFGGSQLASYLIIQNTNQVHVAILALFVQAAPLAMTPFLIKFSGSLLGRLAGMVDSPNKGLVDRTRNWSKERADMFAKRAMDAGQRRSGWRPTGLAYRRQARKRIQADRTKLYESRLDAAWENDIRSQRIQSQMKMSELRKSAGSATAERMFEMAKEEDKGLQTLTGIKRLEEARTKMYHGFEEARWSEAMTGKVNPEETPDHMYAQFGQEAFSTMREQRVADSNAAIAQALQKREYSMQLDADEKLQHRAGGSIDPVGPAKAKATAWTEVINAGGEDAKAIKTASPLEPGDIEGMYSAFVDAVKRKDIASMRAHADMMAEANDPGIRKLRQAIMNTEVEIRQDPGVLSIFRHHINGSDILNRSAEDIVVWSRDADTRDGTKEAWRRLEDIGRDPFTWGNLKPTQFANLKASTQMVALEARHADGRPAITQEMAAKILDSDITSSEIKGAVLPKLYERAGRSLRIQH